MSVWKAPLIVGMWNSSNPVLYWGWVRWFYCNFLQKNFYLFINLIFCCEQTFSIYLYWFLYNWRVCHRSHPWCMTSAWPWPLTMMPCHKEHPLAILCRCVPHLWFWSYCYYPTLVNLESHCCPWHGCHPIWPSSESSLPWLVDFETIPGGPKEKLK